MRIVMEAVKETPGTVLFKEPSRSDGKARNLYLPKADFDALGRPERIIITVERG